MSAIFLNALQNLVRSNISFSTYELSKDSSKFVSHVIMVDEALQLVDRVRPTLKRKITHLNVAVALTTKNIRVLVMLLLHILCVKIRLKTKRTVILEVRTKTVVLHISGCEPKKLRQYFSDCTEPLNSCSSPNGF